MHQSNRVWRSVLLAACALLLSSAAFASEVLTREFKSSTLGRAWKYEVYLPTGYETSRLRYPVLYLLHGNNGSGKEWIQKGKVQSVADGLIAKREMPPAVIVMPDAGVTWYVDRKEKMETAMLRDLFPEVEKNLRVLRSREGRLIGGLSMGGYGSLRFVLKYPEMFAAAALLSPAIYEPLPPQNSSARKVGTFGAPAFDEQVWKSLNYPALWQGYLAKKQPVPMYINSGDDDDFMIEAEATKLYSLLRANQQPAELRIVDGAHTWAVWGSTLGDAMKYMFRYSAKPASAE
ncbi:alpha/beta hydrolase [Steroidobacter cummioxidans]|uniref:alpha/beta hydrolase n=1 Tax=Steroidobacter cummioxidans TaxID=1803913 RepID=UPI000E31017B|nr:alpha/beta hydrolase-fold protein [Steroidobacter cummioxidans]